MRQRFAGRRNTVVARGAVADDSLVIENSREETASRDMADTAVIRRWHVRRIGLGILAGCIGAVMTGVAAKRHDLGTAVIYKCVEEARRVVTGRAVTAGIVVNRGIRFPPGASGCIRCTAIMARDTVSGDAGMTEDRRQERGHRMAAVTVLGGWYVYQGLDQIHPVREESNHVATFTTTGVVHMYRTQKCR